MSGGVPDLTALDEGDDVEVYYQSERSGNEVERSGVVAFTYNPEDGEPVVWVHTEAVTPFKHRYLTLTTGEATDGSEIVVACSVTTEADTDGIDDPPRPFRTYSYKLESVHSTVLGIADRIIRDDPGGAMFLTVLDGSSDTEQGGNA